MGVLMGNPSDRGMEWHLLENSNFTLWTHNKNECRFPERCVVHNRSDHHMRLWPQHWRMDRGIMERICPHGVGHPDPDQMYYFEQLLEPRAAHAQGVHGCDGCCA